MADPALDDFLGVKPAPAWQRYAKWVAIGIGVVAELMSSCRDTSAPPIA